MCTHMQREATSFLFTNQLVSIRLPYIVIYHITGKVAISFFLLFPLAGLYRHKKYKSTQSTLNSLLQIKYRGQNRAAFNLAFPKER